MSAYTKMKIAGVTLPYRSDSSLSVSMTPIAEAGDFRRGVNGELIRMSRSVFDRFAVRVSGGGLNTPPISHIAAGDYTEIALPDHVQMTLNAAGNAASYPRSMIDVEGFVRESDGRYRKVLPVAQPANHSTSMTTVFNAARVANLRSPISVSFPEPVDAARGRPVLACRVLSWEIDNDDVSKDASWTLELEEI